jgi:hypothetical protein
MRRLLIVLLLLVVGVIGLGYDLGWFHFSTDQTNQNPDVQITIDQEKIRKDKEKAEEKIREAGQKVKESIGSRSEKNEDSRP